MNYKVFQKSVLEEVKRRTGEDVRLCETTKNNSVVRVGIIMGGKRDFANNIFGRIFL